MANYGTKYRLDWESRTAPCRVDLQKDGYSSGVQALTPATAPLTIRWGEPERPDLTRALMQSEATVRFRGDSTGEAVSEVFDAPDRTWRVVFQRDTGAGLEDEWYGFLKTDEWRDNQRRDSDIVELAAIGGLQLLQNVDYDLAGTDVYTALRTIMRGVHPFNIAANCEWYPYRGGNQIPGSSLPLSNLTISGQAFDEIEKIEGEKGFKTTGRRDRHRALEAILERFGMRAFQSRGEWIARQRTQVQSIGEIKEWPNSTAVANNNPTTRDLSRSLPTPFQTDQPRGLVRRLRNAESAHTYNNLGQLVRNSGFEVGGGSKTGWSGGGFVQNYDNTRVLKNSTQENTYVLHLENDTTSPFAGDKITQDVPAIIHDPGPTGAIEFEWLVSQKENDEGNPTLITGISLGSDYYAQQQGVDVDGKAEAAEDGTLAISNPIPGQNGAVIIPQGGFLYTPPLIDAPRLEVLSPVREGDTEINARIPADIPDGANLTYYTWSTQTLSFDPGPNRPDVNYRGFLEGTNGNPIDGDTMAQQKIVMPLNAPDGTRLAERELSFEFKTQIIDTLLDDVTARLLKGGEPVGETSFIAQDDQAGEEISITQFIGDGPTFDHPRSLSLSGVEVTQDWKVGAYSSGASRSGQLIEEVTAEAAHRQQRETAQRFTENVPLVQGDEIWPHDVFSIGGALYSVTFLERTFSQEESVQAELTELKDAGTSGLTRTFSMNTRAENSSGGGGFVGGASGDGSGSVDAAWSEITGKPSGLFAQNGDTDGFATTIEPTYDTSGPTADGPKFIGAGENIQWRRDPSSDTALEVRDTTNGTRLLWLDDNGRLHTRRDQEAFADGGGSSASGVNSLLQVEDGQGDVLTTDAASLQFTGSGISLTKNGDDITVDVSGGSGSDIDIEQNQTPVVGGATGVSFEGSGIDSVDNDGDGTATVRISKGSSTEIQEGGTAQVSDATVLDFAAGDFSVTNPTSGEAEVSLQDDTVTVAGNSVSLGNSTGINHGDLSSIGSDDHHPKTTSASDLTDVSADSVSGAHHTRYSDEEAQDAVGTIISGAGAATVTYDDVNNTITVSSTDTDTQLSDSEVQTAINNDTDHGSTASHNYTTSASDLTDVSPDSDSDAHHTQPSTGDGLTGSTTFKVDSTVARTNAKDVFEDQIRIDGPLAGSDSDLGAGSNGYVLALGGKPYGIGDADGTGDDRLGSGLLQNAHGATSDYRIYLQGGHGRVAHTWNAYYDNNASKWRSVVDNEPHTLVGIGNTSPGNVNGGGVTLATTGSSTSAEDAITWNVGVHVDVDGKVGIGDITDPSHALEVGGDMKATGEVEAFLGSDRRLKTDLDPLDSALDKVSKLTGYGFDWRETDAVQPHKRGETDVGLIAQEVEGVLPKAVKELQDGHSEGYKSVAYDKLVPLLVEAIKDLRSQVNQLQ